jgi:hypothetical protein
MQKNLSIVQEENTWVFTDEVTVKVEESLQIMLLVF